MSTSTSERAGFTLIEVLVALFLSLLLLSAVAGLWAGLEGRSVELADRLVWMMQARVAGVRLERDLRAATATNPQGVDGSSLLLEAGTTRVVLLSRSGDGLATELVAWEAVSGRLMRRRGEAGGAGGGAPAGGWRFTDHKTMLEPVGTGTGFRFFAGARVLASPLSAADLLVVDRVELTASRLGTSGQGAGVVLCEAGVGR